MEKKLHAINLFLIIIQMLWVCKRSEYFMPLSTGTEAGVFLQEGAKRLQMREVDELNELKAQQEKHRRELKENRDKVLERKARTRRKAKTLC